MQFILTGFTPDTGFRVFAFEGIAADRTRIEYTVRTDLALSRTYGIRLQELPLLCRAFLERREESDLERTLTFNEDEMRLHAKGLAADKEAAEKRKSTRKHPPHQQNSGWASANGSMRTPAMTTAAGAGAHIAPIFSVFPAAETPEVDTHVDDED